MENRPARASLTVRPDARATHLVVSLRAYASLNDFLDRARCQCAVDHVVEPRTSIKDFVERAGIPHPEIDLLLVNGDSVGFEYLLHDGDRVAAFPRFMDLDVGSLSRVRPPAPARMTFLLDVHLGQLARRLRLAGLDASYSTAADDDALAVTAAMEDRVLLTRDVALLKRRIVTHGYFVRATGPHDQFVEILHRFSPQPILPFSRCLECNGELRPELKASLVHELPPRIREHYDEFRRCTRCRRIYWKGTHYARLVRALEHAMAAAGTTPVRTL